MTKSTGNIANAPADRTLTTSRVFDAPREVVYHAWTDPKQLARWFPPDGMTAECELDVRPGGSLRIDMKGAAPGALKAHAECGSRTPGVKLRLQLPALAVIERALAEPTE